MISNEQYVILKQMKDDMSTCTVCGLEKIYVNHHEPDGINPAGSHEPYWECPNNCDELLSVDINLSNIAGGL